MKEGYPIPISKWHSYIPRSITCDCECIVPKKKTHDMLNPPHRSTYIPGPPKYVIKQPDIQLDRPHLILAFV